MPLVEACQLLHFVGGNGGWLLHLPPRTFGSGILGHHVQPSLGPVFFSFPEDELESREQYILLIELAHVAPVEPSLEVKDLSP